MYHQKKKVDAGLKLPLTQPKDLFPGESHRNRWALVYRVKPELLAYPLWYKVSYSPGPNRMKHVTKYRPVTEIRVYNPANALISVDVSTILTNWPGGRIESVEFLDSDGTVYIVSKRATDYYDPYNPTERMETNIRVGGEEEKVEEPTHIQETANILNIIMGIEEVVDHKKEKELTEYMKTVAETTVESVKQIDPSKTKGPLKELQTRYQQPEYTAPEDDELAYFVPFWVDAWHWKAFNYKTDAKFNTSDNERIEAYLQYRDIIEDEIPRAVNELVEKNFKLTREPDVNELRELKSKGYWETSQLPSKLAAQITDTLATRDGFAATEMWFKERITEYLTNRYFTNSETPLLLTRPRAALVGNNNSYSCVSFPKLFDDDRWDCFYNAAYLTNKFGLYDVLLRKLMPWREYSSGNEEERMITSLTNGKIFRYDGAKSIRTKFEATHDETAVDQLYQELYAVDTDETYLVENLDQLRDRVYLLVEDLRDKLPLVIKIKDPFEVTMYHPLFPGVFLQGGGESFADTVGEREELFVTRTVQKLTDVNLYS